MKKLSTKKLFFNQYPYKVELSCKGASLLRLRGVDTVISMAKSGKPFLSRSSWRHTDPVDNVEMHNFAICVKPFIDAGYKYRAEGRHFNFFLKDKESLEAVRKACDKFVTATWSPASDDELEFLTSNKRKVIVDALPYGQFQYKVVFKTNWKEIHGKNFVNWLEKYPEDSYLISPSTHRYLTGESRYCQDPFMYISEGKMLTLLTLFAGDNIKYTAEFVPRSTLLL